ncbi:hypothetical protein Tco_1576071 [Tanacetum coccineum]
MASVSKSVSKSISIPNEEFLDNTSPSVAQKFLNEVKGTIVTLQQADESLAKHKSLEYEIERLLRAFVSQHIMLIVQSNFVVDTLNLQTELDHTKEKVETCIIKKEKEYAVLWNNWYKKCEECKYDKISYDKAYNDMQHQIERLQAHLGDLKGQSSNTQYASNTLDPLSHKLDDENMSLEYQVLNYAKENEHLKNIYKNLFDSIKVTRAQTKIITDSLQEKLNDTIYENAMLRAQLHTKFSEQQNKVKGAESTAKTRRPQTRRNPKNDRIPSASKSSCLSNNLEKVEVHHRNLLFSKTPNHRSSVGNNIKLVVRNDKSEVVCATCKQCLITAKHDECVFKYVNGMNSSKKNQSANVSKSANQKKHKPIVKKSKKLGFEERLASPRPSKPRTCLRWLPTGRIFYLCGKITTSSNIESESNTYMCDNASASNPQEPTSKGFPNSTSFLDRQVDGVSTIFQLSRSQGHILILKDQGYIQGINQDLKKALKFKDTLPQALINKNFLKEHQVHNCNQEVSKFISRLKHQDIKAKAQDIKIKIKIQDLKHAKGTSKEFLSIQGSKIQDVTT